MRTRKRHLGLYMILASLAGAASVPLPAEDDAIAWLSNYREAIRQARQTGKPILVEFRCEA